MKRWAAILLSVPAAALADAGTEHFESKVRPLLVKHCYECHSAEKTKGGLALDTKAGWKKGGDSGPAIVPGRPEESLLIKAVRYEDKELAMPPQKKGGKLPDSDIAALAEWVKMHEKLTFRHAGLDYRLAGVEESHVVKEVLA